MFYICCYKSVKFMARILIKVEKDNVKTSKLGNNIMVQCDNNIDLIFYTRSITRTYK